MTGENGNDEKHVCEEPKAQLNEPQLLASRFSSHHDQHRVREKFASRRDECEHWKKGGQHHLAIPALQDGMHWSRSVEVRIFQWIVCVRVMTHMRRTMRFVGEAQWDRTKHSDEIFDPLARCRTTPNISVGGFMHRHIEG